MILRLFGEGVVSAALPCSWVLLVPTVLAVLAGLGARKVAGGALAGATVGLMLRAAGVAAMPTGFGIVAGFLLAVAMFATTRTGQLAPAGALVVGLVSASVWQPCVGEQLGTVLNTGVDRPFSAALAMVPYALGTLLALPATAFLAELANDAGRRRLRRLAIALGIVLAFGLATGLHEPVIGGLARWSTSLAS